MYIILGWVGWIWLPVMMTLLGVGLGVQHLRRRRATGARIRGDDER
jgi:hypothetical protein